MVQNPLWILLWLALSCAAPSRAQNPPNSAAVQEFTQKAESSISALKTPQAHLQAPVPAFTPDDHAAAAKALADLATLLDPIKAKVPQVAAAVKNAASAESDFWSASQAIPPPQPEEQKKSAQALGDKLELVCASFDLVLGKDPTPSSAVGSTDPQGRQRMAEKATALASIRSEVTAAKGDSAVGLINGFYGVKGGGSAGDLTGGTPVVAGGTTSPTPVPVEYKEKGVHFNDVPLTAADTPPIAPKTTPLPAKLDALADKEALCAAADKTPVVGTAAARQCSTVGRDWRLISTVRTGADWVRDHHDELKAAGKDPDKLLTDVDAAFALPDNQRKRALLGLQKRLDDLLAASPMGLADAQLQQGLTGLKGPLSDADKQQLASALAAMREKDPNYFKARGLWAEYVNFNRTNLKSFPDGASFKGEELGLPPPKDQITLTKTTLFGGGGMLTKGQDGMKHFEGSDGSVADEVNSDGKTLWVRKRKNGDSLTISTYDAQGNKLGGVVYEKGDHGQIAMHPEGHDLPRQTGRMVEGKFVADKIENADGTSRESAGRAAPGAWTLKDKDGKAIGWTLDAGPLSTGTQAQRSARAEQIAQWAVAQGFNGTNGNVGDKYNSQAVASMLKDVFRQPRAGVTDTQIYMDRAQGQLVVNMTTPYGVYQMMGKFEDTMSGQGVGKGLPNKGLSLYVRSAKSPDDQTSKFTRIVQYEGDWGRETQTSSTDSNVDKWYSWVVGPKVTETTQTQRAYRQDDGQGGWTWQNRGQPVVGKPVTIYEGSGIVGATGQAVGTLGKGAVDLVVAGSANQAADLLSVAGMFDGRAANASNRMREVARVNLEDNALFTTLGHDYGGQKFDQWHANQHLDDKLYVQNVRQTLTDAGHPGWGAVAGGVVDVANQVAPMLVGGEVLEGVAGLGKVGQLAAKGVGYVWSAQAVYGAGKATGEFAVAAYDYHLNPNDPRAKQAFYDNVENITTQALYAPMTVGIVSSALKGVKGRVGPEPTPGGGRPPVEPGLEPVGIPKTEGGGTDSQLAPGTLTKILATAGVTGPAAVVPEPVLKTPTQVDVTGTPHDPVIHSAADALIKKATQAEPAVTAHLQTMAEANGGELVGLKNRLKTQESLRGKISGDMKELGLGAPEAAERIGDALRYTSILPERSFTKGAQATLDHLVSEGYKIRKIKNTYQEGSIYKGINASLISPDGQIFELQFHTQESFAVKTAMHKDYEVLRDPNASVEARRAAYDRMQAAAATLQTPADVESLGTLIPVPARP
jgi:hypothetical protein